MPAMTPDDDGYIGYVLSDVARLMRTVFDRRVREIGLTRSQWLVLSRLHRRPGASQSELAEMLELDRASAGRMLDRMEKGGWVERRPDGGDRRINRLHLTPEAQRVHAEMWEIAEATVDDALATLSATERATFTRFAARVKARLQALAALDTPLLPAEPVSPLRASERGEASDTSPPAKRGEREGPARSAGG
jgi:MarR family transcriptional regulator for hemolysin